MLGKEFVRQGREPLLLRHGGAGAALGLIGAVEILELGEGLGRVDGLRKLLRELALLLDGALDRLLALLQIAQIGEAVGEIAEAGVVHCAVQFLAVARDEGDGVPLVQKFDDVFNVAQGPVQFPRQDLTAAFQSGLLLL